MEAWPVLDRLEPQRPVACVEYAFGLAHLEAWVELANLDVRRGVASVVL